MRCKNSCKGLPVTLFCLLETMLISRMKPGCKPNIFKVLWRPDFHRFIVEQIMISFNKLLCCMERVDMFNVILTLSFFKIYLKLISLLLSFLDCHYFSLLFIICHKHYLFVLGKPYKNIFKVSKLHIFPSGKTGLWARQIVISDIFVVEQCLFQVLL